MSTSRTPQPHATDWIRSLRDDLETLTQVTTDPLQRKVPRLRAGELRNCAVFFLDLQGFTKLAEDVSSEEAHNLLDKTFRIFTNVIEAHDGYVDKYIGDAILAVFGSRKAEERPSEKAVRAALSILERIEYINQALSPRGYQLNFRIGINYGEVTFGQMGTAETTTVIGDPVNVAQRIQASAPINSLVITQKTAEYLGNNFLYTNPQVIEVKGRENPVKIVEVTGVNPHRFERWERHKLTEAVPFVGRVSEMGMLREVYEAASAASLDKLPAERHNFLVSVHGSPGFGKTRLIHEFTRSVSAPASAKPSPVLLGRCPDRPSDGFFVLRDMIVREVEREQGSSITEKLNRSVDSLKHALGAFHGEVADRLDESLVALGYLTGAEMNFEKLLDMEPQALQLELRLAVRAFFEATAVASSIQNQTPLIAVFDDMQWANDETISHLEFIFAQMKPQKPCMFIWTHRPEFTVSERFKAMTEHSSLFVGPLAEAEMRMMISSMLSGANLPAGLEEEVLVKAEGNPFYLEELIIYLLEEGFLEVNAEEKTCALIRPIEEFDVPHEIQHLVLSRIDTLDKPLKLLLQKCSVIGRRFDIQHLAMIEKLLATEFSEHEINELLDMMVLDQVLLPAEEDGSTTGGYMFKHVLQQEAAYRTLLRYNRKVLHRLTAQTAETLYADALEEHYEMLAYHWEQAEEYEIAIEYYLKTAHRLLLTAHYPRCEHAARRVAALLDKVEAHPVRKRELLIESRLKLGDALAGMGRYDEAETIAKDVAAAAEEYQNRLWRAYAIGLHGRILAGQAKYDDALDSYLKALEVMKISGDEAGQAQTYRAMGDVHYRSGRFPVAYEAYTTALKMQQKVGDRWAEGITKTSLGAVHIVQGRMDQGYESLESALALRRRIGDRQGEAICLSEIGLLSSLRADLDNVDEKFERAQKVAEEIRDRATEAGIRVNSARLAYMRQDWDKCQEALEDAAVKYRSLGDVRGESESRLHMARLRLAIGQIATAEADCDRALKGLTAVNDQSGLGRAYDVKGEVLIHRGDYQAAFDSVQKCLDTAKRIGDKTEMPFALYNLGRIYYFTKRFNESSDTFRSSLNFCNWTWNHYVSMLANRWLALSLLSMHATKEAVPILHRAAAIGRTYGVATDELLSQTASSFIHAGHSMEHKQPAEAIDTVAKMRKSITDWQDVRDGVGILEAYLLCAAVYVHVEQWEFAHQTTLKKPEILGDANASDVIRSVMKRAEGMGYAPARDRANALLAAAPSRFW